MNKFAAKSNLLVARLQRTKPFCDGAPVQYEFAPLLAEANEWLSDIEHSIDEIPDAELLTALDNYDLLHRIVRQTPGTALLRYAYSRILRNASGKSIVEIDSYVIDAYYKLTADANTERDFTGSEELTGGEDFEILTKQANTHRRNSEEFKFLTPGKILTKKSSTKKSNTQKFPDTILHYWSESLSNPLNPLPSMPELIARLRLLLQYTGGEEFEFLTKQANTILLNYAINLLQHSLKEHVSASVLHALLTLTIRLKPALIAHINVERTISRLQKRLAEAPDNHPLDRAARCQTLDNAEAFAKALALITPY